ncbi:FAD-binding oxidoreductase [Sphingorhabdus soli]|uniref:FAD-binding oxidoreductase n=1 Tax=Flavisphingopyxis soli TaxID=2601267 RepID=A0A5C6UKU9_9SPHN|nr:FAD-binding oxidoreductase [Sphingorhabdus soli]TXC73772.1 FAD-binding oxidoreductase [Sphingorhabdus soli]
MKLDPNVSLWQSSCVERLSSRPLASHISTDLVIIGGGFTGVSAALEAAQAGTSVCLLDAREVGFGGSGRNVGLVNAGLWLPPERVCDQLGKRAGAKLVDVLSRAPDDVFGLIDRHAIDCEGTRGGTLHCAHSPSGLKDLRDRFNQGLSHGAPYQLLNEEETSERTGSYRFFGAMFDPRAGTIQPLSYCRGLARAAQTHGAGIYEHSPVISITHKNGTWHVGCADGSVVGNSLLIATNAYQVGMEDILRPNFTKVSYFQCATPPLPAAQLAKILPGGEGCWDTALVMSSFRKDEAGRLIIGGVGRLDSPAHQIHLNWARKKITELFPELVIDQFDYHWAGNIAMTSDHIPKIFEVGPNALACFGYSGRGIGPGTVFGAAASRALRENDFAHLPIEPITKYAERFSSLKRHYYEAGALVSHASGINI